MNIILILSGLVVTYVGAGMLFVPVPFFEFNSAVMFVHAVDKLNEFRGLGAVLFIQGLFIIYSGFKNKSLAAAYDLSIVIYFSFAFGRLVSVACDGIPNGSIILIIVTEICIGLLCLYGKQKTVFTENSVYAKLKNKITE